MIFILSSEGGDRPIFIKAMVPSSKGKWENGEGLIRVSVVLSSSRVTLATLTQQYGELLSLLARPQVLIILRKESFKKLSAWECQTLPVSLYAGQEDNS